MFRKLLDERGLSLFDRKLEDHFTGSVIVVNMKDRKLLLTFHPYYQIWQQLGGHDETEHDPLGVAEREAAEESGIEDLWVLDVPVRIDPHPAYACRTVPGEHKNYHYDICYMAVAPDERFAISDESEDMRWFGVDELGELVEKGQAQQRALEMARNSLTLLDAQEQLGDLPKRP
jgi:ADP-ribose pyrophosphatase YjhB (NUDIX family)